MKVDSGGFLQEVRKAIEAITNEISDVYDLEDAVTMFGYANASICKLAGNNLQDEINFLSELQEPSLFQVLSMASLNSAAKEMALDITQDAFMKATGEICDMADNETSALGNFRDWEVI